MSIHTLLYILIYFIFLIMIKDFLDFFFEAKKISGVKKMVIWTFYYITEVILCDIINQSMAKLAITVLLMVILCKFLYKESIKKIVIYLLILNMLCLLIEFLTGYLFLILEKDCHSFIILGSLVSKLITFMVAKDIKLYLKLKITHNFPAKYWLSLFLVQAGCIFILYTLFILCNQEDKPILIFHTVLAVVFLLGLNINLFQVYHKLSEQLDSKKQNVVFEKQVELCKQQLKLREDDIMNVKNIRHDLKNHLICIKEYASKKDFDGLNKYINMVFMNCNEFISKEVAQSGNLVIDALINYKYCDAKKLGIQMNVKLEIPYELSFHDGDLCIILSNALDNAIEAVSKLSSNEKVIDLSIIYKNNNLFINIRNPFDGILIKDNKSNILTSKNDSRNHGIGLMSIKKAANKYHGLVNIKIKENLFNMQVLLYS